MVNLVLIGPPGAGKGTQAEQLVRSRSLLHISTGDLLRDAIKNKTPLGLKARVAVDSGELVPDDVVIGLVDECLSRENTGKGFILDGFPRTRPQAVALEYLLEKHGKPLDHVLLFEIPPEDLEGRIEQRAQQAVEVGAVIRSDDNANVLKKRLLEFQHALAELSPYYENLKLLRCINAKRPIKEVSKEIEALLGQPAKETELQA